MTGNNLAIFCRRDSEKRARREGYRVPMSKQNSNAKMQCACCSIPYLAGAGQRRHDKHKTLRDSVPFTRLFDLRQGVARRSAYFTNGLCATLSAGLLR